VKNKIYPAGFTNQIASFGYPLDYSIPDTGTHPVTNGIVTLVGGNLPASKNFTFDLADKAANTNHIKLNWSAEGWVRGTFTHPVTHHLVKLYGVYLRDPDHACGFFLGTNESGSFSLHP